MDPSWTPPTTETRQVYGVSLEQRRNDAKIDGSLFSNAVSQARDVPVSSLTDLIVATVALKYTQSNSVCYALRGGVIGLGAGQQSRIHCTRLAGDKADAWWLRHHPRVLALRWKPDAKRADRANAIDLYVTGEAFRTDAEGAERKAWEAMFADGDAVPRQLTGDERKAWMDKLKGRVALASDAFFPFSDNVYRAARSGVGYVAAPGGSVMDDAVIKGASPPRRSFDASY
jgi:phosphoribosylaminoimidazolecarboxamide formyltransferase/IMP cyclohydrolase